MGDEPSPKPVSRLIGQVTATLSHLGVRSNGHSAHVTVAHAIRAVTVRGGSVRAVVVATSRRGGAVGGGVSVAKVVGSVMTRRHVSFLAVLLV